MNGLNLTSKQLYSAIYFQMIVGVLVINSISLSTGIFGLMAQDFEKRKTEAFLLTKATPMQFMTSYLIASVLVCFGLNFLMWLASFLIIGISTGVWLGFIAFLSVVAVLVIVTFISCSIMLLITCLVKSSVAIAVINGILGTILGFLCGIYMPYSNMGAGAKYVGSLLPFTHLSVWLKQIVLKDVFGQFGVSKEIQTATFEWFSASNIGLCGLKTPLWLLIMLGVIVGLVCLIASVLIINSKLHNKKDISTKKLKAYINKKN